MARSPLRSFVRLAAADRAVLIRSILTLAAARVAIWILPFRTVRRLLSPRPHGIESDVITRDRVKWAIGHAQRIIPDATC